LRIFCLTDDRRFNLLPVCYNHLVLPFSEFECFMSPYFLALLAALSFALGSALQQRGTLQTNAKEGDPRFLAEILRKPVWLVGGALQISGWVLQGAALVEGSLMVVQSLCALSLVFALPFGARLSGQVVSRRSVIGAFVTLIGIIVFVAVGQPQGGIDQPEAPAWIAAVIFISLSMTILAWLAARRRGAAAAALFSTAAGFGYAFQAAVTKVFVTQLGSGVLALLASWTTYGLIVSALAGFALQQSALKTGFLAPAMAACNASSLAMSVFIGVTLFEETISRGEGRLSPALIGLALAIAGVIMLASPEKRNLETAVQ
jgi:drug/metabolite transporter (DMT)-like permease